MMKTIIFFTLLVGTSYGLGGAKCAWGPKYWCENLPQAASCRAVRHCIQTVWEQKTVPQDDDEVCQICKEMVTEARDTLESNETQIELKQVFEGSCALIPLKVIADECKKMVDQFIPELVETLASQMNPDVVCTVSGLCNSKRIDSLLLHQKSGQNQVGGMTGCGTCIGSLSLVENSLRSMSDNEIELRLLDICAYMDSYSDACMYTVSEELPTIIALLRDELTPQLCYSLADCPANVQIVTSVQQAAIGRILDANEDLECEFCEKVVKHWIDTYASNASIAEFKDMLDGICEKLDKNNAQHCKHIVDDYYIPAFQFIRRLNPEWVCSTVGLCPIQGQVWSNNIYRPNIKDLAYDVKDAADLMPAIKTPPSDVSEKPTCVLCEYVMHELQTFLKDGNTVDEIKGYLEAVCDKLPSAVGPECHKFVEDYEPLIVSLLVEKLDPSEVCPKLKLCDPPAMIGNAIGGKPYCETCQFVLNEVFAVLNDKDDRRMVRNVLESVCYRLPTSIDTPCEQFVDKYTDQVLDMIGKSLTPDEICSGLDLCEETQDTQKQLEDTGCVLCEYVIANLDHILEDKKNEEQIKDALESVCAIMPNTVRKECVKFVESYTDMIIELLTHDITPKEICTNLGLCKATNDIAVVDLDYPDVSDRPYCTLCQFAMVQLDTMLKDKSNEDEIKKALDVVCLHLSLPVHKECLKVVDTYTDKIIDLILKEYTPEMICSELSLCDKQLIISNDISRPVVVTHSQPSKQLQLQGESVGCVMCEFAMQVLDEHLNDQPTIDQVERMVQFLCSYLPGSIADQCEDFVDKNGQRIIDALVKGELDPKEVCTVELQLCDAQSLQNQLLADCIWGKEMWCASPLHARICGTTYYCQETAWRRLKNNN